jgi:hypothetical protein
MLRPGSVKRPPPAALLYIDASRCLFVAWKSNISAEILSGGPAQPGGSGGRRTVGANDHSPLETLATAKSANDPARPRSAWPQPNLFFTYHGGHGGHGEGTNPPATVRRKTRFAEVFSICLSRPVSVVSVPSVVQNRFSTTGHRTRPVAEARICARKQDSDK